MSDSSDHLDSLAWKLRSVVGEDNVLVREPMSEHTTFAIGGPADLYVIPDTVDDVREVVAICREAEIPHFVLGKGSDLLVSDDGYRGVIIAIADGLVNVSVDGNEMCCQAGVPLREASEMACELGLTGLEFACGIPGSVGGACFMNAGAYDGCMADVLSSVTCLMPDGSVRDIALISRVGKPVAFRVTGFEQGADGETRAVLSRRAVQADCVQKLIRRLAAGDVIGARVTHLESFGVFADVGAGLSALMPIDSISVSRIPHPNVRFQPGQDIRAVVKGVDEQDRITLSHKELLGTWEQNAAEFEAGQTVAGVVRSVEKYGVFVELTPNLAGLAEYAEGVEAGQGASVYIKSILPERMKIKLIIVDSFAGTAAIPPVRYFTDCDHLDRWIYSPETCGKVIETVF